LLYKSEAMWLKRGKELDKLTSKLFWRIWSSQGNIYMLTLGQDIAILQVNVTHTAYCHSKILPQRVFQPPVFLPGGIAKVPFFSIRFAI